MVQTFFTQLVPDQILDRFGGRTREACRSSLAVMRTVPRTATILPFRPSRPRNTTWDYHHIGTARCPHFLSFSSPCLNMFNIDRSTSPGGRAVPTLA